MRIRNYILNEKGQPIEEPDVFKWVRWFSDINNCRVVATQIGESRVSTIFLGLDHNYAEVGPPILWETMVFGGNLTGSCQRCSGSKEQAEAMHQAMVDEVRNAECKIEETNDT